MADILASGPFTSVPSWKVSGGRRVRGLPQIPSRVSAELRSSLWGKCRLLNGTPLPFLSITIHRGRSPVGCSHFDGSLIPHLVASDLFELLGQSLQSTGVIVGGAMLDFTTNFHVDGLGQIFEGVGSAQEAIGAVSAIQTVVGDGFQAFSALPDNDKLRIVGISSGGWIYLTARPGVLAGAFDGYVLSPFQRIWRKKFKRSDFAVGERLGEGSFGIVYAGVLLPKDVKVDEEFGRRGKRIEELKGYKRFQKVVLKKVKVGVQGAVECGEMEEWFNYRMIRAAPDACAPFLGSFVADTTRGQFTKGGKWLVWKLEGDSNLGEFMQLRDFPENLGEAVFGRPLNEENPLKRDALIIKKIFRQIIISLKLMHDNGIVHRDVKPSNVVVTNKGKLKLIDFGAATDLRVGKNYVPDRGMLDPDYCPPELFVLPERTPVPPPAPVAAFLSPILWQINHPDLFDTYSAGIILLQMASPTLRCSISLQKMKKELEAVDYDLKKWRKYTRLRPNLEILDLDGGKGWDLATKLVCKRGNFLQRRLSAASALRHPYFLLGLDQAVTVLTKLKVAR